MNDSLFLLCKFIRVRKISFYFINRGIPAFLICFIAVAFARAQSPCLPVALLCENLTNPIGIDAPHPRLSWQLKDNRQNAVQTGYQIFIGTDSNVVSKGKGNIYQTTKLNAARQMITCSNTVFQPFTRYFWKVLIWDKNNRPSASSVNSFEMGMMEMHHWQGAWISDQYDMHKKQAPYFRTSFTSTKKIRSARAYIAAAGLYELYLNGNRIGDHRLDPMYTRFDRRNLYVTYDITQQLQPGNNVAGVLLGNGWYNHQSVAVWDFHKAKWRDRPAFCMDIRITYEDGTVSTTSTDRNWKTALSPVIFNSIYTAEQYDARLEQPGWNTAAFIDTGWGNISYRSAPSANIVAQVMHPVRNVDTIVARSIQPINDSTYVFDFGRNISGVSELAINGPSGTIVRLKHSERLYPNGRADQSNIDVHYRPVGTDDPFQTDIYILDGKGAHRFMPHFNYKGFQFVEVTCSRPISLTKENLTAYFMHSDVPIAGTISSANPTINKIWQATNSSYLSNLFGYPTDCPQREKNGWTGDGQIAVETGLYNFDGITIYEKWMADHRDEQQPNGVLPSIIPTNGWGYEWGNGPDWTSTIAIIPWNVYLFYGDSKILSDNYANMKLYVDHITSISPAGLTTWGLGDWVPVKSQSPVELTSSCYYFADASIVAKVAKILGHQADHEKYTALATTIQNAINKKYLHTATGIYGNGIQTAMAVPLFWGVVPDNLLTKVAGKLAERVKADSNHLDVGLLGTKAILNALSENGYAATAYTLAAQESLPSWGWWIKNGATTLYENWPIDAKSDISMNHIMFGEIGAWFYKGLGGIKPDPKYPGFKNILLQPHFVDSLDHFEATHNGPYGMIKSAWKRSNGGITYTVTIPANSTGQLLLPVTGKQKIYKDGELTNTTSFRLPAGTFLFEIK